MATTLPMTPAEIAKAAEHMADKNDRYAFFVALIIGGAFFVLAIRYLVGQVNALVAQAREDSKTMTLLQKGHADEMKLLIREQATVIQANTVATEKQSILLTEVGNTMRAATAELEASRRAKGDSTTFHRQQQ